MHSSHRSGFHFGRDGAKGLDREWSGSDGPANHEIIRACLDRFGGRHHSFLVAGIAARGADSWSHDDEVFAKMFTQGANLSRAGHHAFQAAPQAHSSEVDHLILRRSGDACGLERFGIHAGEDGDSEDERFRIPRGDDGIRNHAGSAAQVDGRHFHSQSGCGADGFHCGVRNVVEFEVQKHAGAEGFEIPHDRGAFGCEKLEADLEKAAFTEKGIREAFGGIGIRRVDGDNDFFLRGAWRGGHLSRRMTLDAPAKVNLTLRVLGRRSDGFHDIETLMVPLTLADRIELVLREEPGVDFSCSDSELPTNGTNLVCKAVVAFERATGREIGVRIHLEKNIPHGAGLGGGSSDAAAVLKALDGLLKTNLGVSKLESIAATIGSDVPFFIRCVPAICRGRGEVVEPVSGVPAAEILLVKPPFPVSTAWAYGAWACANKSGETFPPSFGSIRMVNDLEAPVFEKHLQLPVLKRWLAAQPGVSAVMMSGSGSTIFALLDGPAEGLGERVRAEFGESFGVWRSRIVS